VALLTALLRLGGLVPGTRVGPFRYSRAVMRTRNATGNNAAALLATAQLGQLAADLISRRPAVSKRSADEPAGRGGGGVSCWSPSSPSPGAAERATP
jgi:hypothetical protein